jgi:3-hydroxyacyl-[acyl-carrier-protein] dehydratase
LLLNRGATYVIAFASLGKENGLGFLTSLKGIEFLGNAHPGDRLDLYYEVVKIKKGFVLGRAQASVDEQVIVSAEEIIIFLTRPS